VKRRKYLTKKQVHHENFCLRSKRPEVRILSGAPHNSFPIIGIPPLLRSLNWWFRQFT
jgi:hypothetical protein